MISRERKQLKGPKRARNDEHLSNDNDVVVKNKAFNPSDDVNDNVMNV